MDANTFRIAFSDFVFNEYLNSLMLKLKTKILNTFKNVYVLIFCVFFIWMSFLDTNSLLIHSELSNEIKKLESQKQYYKSEISRDTNKLKILKTNFGLEKEAREKYYMKRSNEDIFVIEYLDDINSKQ